MLAQVNLEASYILNINSGKLKSYSWSKGAITIEPQAWRTNSNTDQNSGLNPFNTFSSWETVAVGNVAATFVTFQSVHFAGE